MARLSQRDSRRAAEVAAAIGECEEGSTGVLDDALPLLRELFETPISVAYRVATPTADEPLEFVKFDGLGRSNAEAGQILDGFFRGMSKRRGLWDVARPQPEQRNRAMIIPWGKWSGGAGPEEIARRLAPDAGRFGLKEHQLGETASTMWELEQGFCALGLRAQYHLRALLCDGDRVVSLVGALQDEPFRERHRLLLRRVIAPLRERLIVERVAGDGGLAHAAMVAGLEHIPSAAFVIDAAGRVLHANAVARHDLASRGFAIRAALRGAIANAPPRADIAVTKLKGPGLPPLFLAISRRPGARVRFGIERARVRWRLTARQVEVLAELAAGRANRDIAERLGARPRTVELHVSAILEKADADSRSQLLVELWRLAE